MAPIFTSIRQISLLSTVITASFLSACVSETAEKSNSGLIPAPNSADSTANNVPKNIIVFIGDGMGVSTITAARIFDGQSKGMSGEEHALSFEDFNNVAMIKTYNTNSQVPDSAGTPTAPLSAYNPNIGAVNVMPDPSSEKMVFADCVRKKSPPTLTEKAKAVNMSVGVISTARITHATPAAMFGHAVDRDWESDADVDPRAAQVGCKGLAEQLIQSDVDLALGGGAKEFSEAQIAAWKDQGHIYVTNSAEMMASPADQRVLGLFTKSHMSFEADREGTEEPSLAEMTSLTIDRLSRNEAGYVMMVEAGRVDHAHHGSNAYRAMRDMQALNDAVKTAKEKAGDDTLIIVTADHSHVFVMQGYPSRGNPILGLVDNRGRDLDPWLL